MPRPPLPFQLRAQDRRALETLLRGGVQQVRVVVRAMALLRLGRGDSAPQVAEVVRLTPPAVRKIAQRYRMGGMARAVFEAPRPGAARWTVRLVAEHAVKRKLVPRVGRETIRVLLQGHDLKPWREKNVVRG